MCCYDGETHAPEGFTRLLAEGNRLQKAVHERIQAGPERK